MKVILEYKNGEYCVKVYDLDGHLAQAGVRENKKQAVQLFDSLVREVKAQV